MSHTMGIDDVWDLYEHFRDFIHTFELSICQDELNLKFMSWNYELIDADLDQDEESYKKQMANFENCLELYIRELVASDTLNVCNITKYRMEFRSEFVLEQRKVFRKEIVNGDAMISVTSTKYYPSNVLMIHQ